MKHWVRGLAAFGAAMSVLLLGSCGKSPEKKAVEPVVTGFRCQAAIQFGEMQAAAELCREDNGRLSAVFKEPKSLAGITMGWDGSVMTVGLGKMQVELPRERVPEGALIRGLLQVLSADFEEGKETEEGYTVTGEVDGKAFALVCDRDSGLPLSLSLPEEKLTASFTNAVRTSEKAGS